MSYISASDSEPSLSGSGCGENCGCAPCKSRGGLSEWYEKEGVEKQQPVRTSTAAGPVSGWQSSGQGFGSYGDDRRGPFSPVVSFVDDRLRSTGCYPTMRPRRLGIRCDCRSGQIGLGGLGEPSTPLQNSLEKIKKALDLNPAGGYVKGSSARSVLDAAFASVPVCLAAKVFIELRFGNSPLARLFKHRLHPKTFREMLDILKMKVQMCLQALKLATLRDTPVSQSCTNIDTVTKSICNNGRLLCKTAAELDELDGWTKCESAINSCRNAAQASRDCH
jgi:hypothetical protein